ncbi:MAG: Ig-like domain-containing protein, partial [Pseudomonadota bacterium]
GGVVSETGTITVNVVPSNVAPTFTALPPAQVVTEDAPLTFTTANGNAITVDDGNGDTLTVTLSLTHGTLAVTPGSGATIAGDGTASVTLTGSAAQINGALEGLTRTNIGDYSGADPITLTVDDGTAAPVTGTIGVAITADADIVADTVTTAEETAIAFNPIAGTNGAEADNFENGAATITAVGAPGNGSVSVAGNVITYTPDGDFVGDDTFTYTVTTLDGNGNPVTETASITVSVTNTNDAPVNTVPGAVQVTDEDVALAIT